MDPRFSGDFRLDVPAPFGHAGSSYQQEIRSSQEHARNLEPRLPVPRPPVTVDFEINNKGVLQPIDTSAKYQNRMSLGKGTHGMVFRAQDMTSGKLVAMKLVKCEKKYENEGVPAQAIREMTLLSELNHPNVLKFYELVGSPTKYFMVLEFMDGDLSGYLRSPQYSGTLNEAMYLLRQILEGMNYCHQVRVIHRDLKTQNLLIELSTRTVKIADFGLARRMQIPVRPNSREVVTLHYRPPELLLGFRIYDQAVDVWSIGCIFGEILKRGVPLFPGTSHLDQISRIFQFLGTPQEDEWPELKKHCARKKFQLEYFLPAEVGEHIGVLRGNLASTDLLLQLLRCNPKKRLSCEQALQHRAFTSSNFGPQM